MELCTLKTHRINNDLTNSSLLRMNEQKFLMKILYGSSIPHLLFQLLYLLIVTLLKVMLHALEPNKQ